MRKMDKELIDQIKENLQAHEEAYTPGAWERFSVQEKKRRRGIIYWPLWSAAAIILIAGVIFLRVNNSNNQSVIVTNKATKTDEKPLVITDKNNSKPTINEPRASNLNQENGVKEQITPDVIDDKTEPVYLAKENSNASLSENNSIIPLIDNTAYENRSNNQNTLLNTIKPEQIAQTPISKNVITVEAKEKPATSKLTFEQILEKDSYANQFAKSDKNKISSKWEPGVFIAPTMGNDNKVNMNYGFSLSYNIAKKLSISSGVAYTALSGKNDLLNNSSGMMDASPAASQAFSSNSKNLESVDASLKGINIPLELKYNISNKFYTGIGVSALAILNNRQENNYIVSQTQNSTVVNSMGYAEQKMLLVTERVSEKQPESVVGPEKYLGFYNFSLGYKQKISPKKNIAVEPFLRLPMKNFSKDNLNLTNGGLRLKLDF